MGATTRIVMFHEAHDCQTWDRCCYFVRLQSLDFHFVVIGVGTLFLTMNANNIITLFSLVTSPLEFLKFSQRTIDIHGAHLRFKNRGYVCSTSLAEAIDGYEEQ